MRLKLKIGIGNQVLNQTDSSPFEATYNKSTTQLIQRITAANSDKTNGNQRNRGKSKSKNNKGRQSQFWKQ